MNEVKLVKKAKKGDKEAFEQLLVLHKDQLYRTAFLYVRNREDALDVVQETAFRSYLAITTLEEEKFFVTWLTKILIRCAYDSIRKRGKMAHNGFHKCKIPSALNRRDHEKGIYL